MKILDLYKKRRRFQETPEPGPGPRLTKASKSLRFVVQRHDASQLHYDFRLEADGVLKSWAIPKGPSPNPKDRRLAVQVEDHPLAYRNFEGTIPKGNYGAGTVKIWDEGTYEPEGVGEGEKKILSGMEKGSFKFTLHGKKLMGTFALVRLDDGKGKNWLLIKQRDKFAADNASSPAATSQKKKGRR